MGGEMDHRQFVARLHASVRRESERRFLQMICSRHRCFGFDDGDARLWSGIKRHFDGEPH